jgi:hypothetical protein
MERNKRKRRVSKKKEAKFESFFDKKIQEREITSVEIEENDLENEEPRYSPRKHKLSGKESFNLGKEKFLEIEKEGKVKADVGDFIAVDYKDGIIAIEKTEDELDRKIKEKGYWSPYQICYRKKRTLTTFSAQSYHVPNEGNQPFLYAQLSSSSDGIRTRRRFGLGI